MTWMILIICSSLHDHGPSDPAKTNGWSISRYRWFLYLTTCAFCWYWIPGWLFKGSIYYLPVNFLGSSSPSFTERYFLTGLSYFTVACWIAPQNPVVNQIFGGFSGLGLLPITFDWTVITGVYFPLKLILIFLTLISIVPKLSFSSV
jgi:OPT oligopeptide transporter protein